MAKHILCPVCQTPMELKQECLALGRDGGGGLWAALAPSYDVDLYACPHCGKVELYTAGWKQGEEKA